MVETFVNFLGNCLFRNSFCHVVTCHEWSDICFRGKNFLGVPFGADAGCWHWRNMGTFTMFYLYPYFQLCHSEPWYTDGNYAQWPKIHWKSGHLFWTSRKFWNFNGRLHWRTFFHCILQLFRSFRHQKCFSFSQVLIKHLMVFIIILYFYFLRSLLDVTRTIFVWGFGLIIPNANGGYWEKFSGLQVKLPKYT